MSGYAVRNDGLGWRSVASENDVLESETFQTDQPVAILLPQEIEQIYSLERQITQRRIREAILGTDNGWLEDIESQIAALRSQL